MQKELERLQQENQRLRQLLESIKKDLEKEVTLNLGKGQSA